MSLLHRALKKAERDRGVPTEGGGIVDHELPEGTGGTKLRLYILVSLVFVSLLGGIYLRLWRGQRPANGALTTASAPQNTGIGNAPEAASLKQTAENLLSNKNWEEAKTTLEKLVILEPRNAELYNNLGLALKQMGSFDAAEEQYQKALSIQPDFVEALNNLGVLFLAKRQLSDAAAQFDKATSLKPDYADPYFHLALLAEAQGKADVAKEQYKKFINLARGVDADFLVQIQQRMGQLGAP